MTDIRRRIALATAIVALAATAACRRDSGKSAAPDDALLQDLEQARGVGLATQNGGTQVVSAIELTGTKASPERRAPRPAATKKQPSYAAAPAPAREEPAPAVVPAADAEPAPSVEPTPDPTPAPAAESREPEASMPMPSRREGRHGGYKSVGEVIRNAPFPINPDEPLSF